MLKNLNQLVKFKTGMDVRIGFPSECLAADTPDEVNQPMYSTSIGLLQKGMEVYLERKENTTVETLEGHEEEEAGELQEGRKPGKSRLRRGKILENLKNTLSDIFDESDVNM